MLLSLLFFFNDTATTEIYTLSLHDALPILQHGRRNSRLRETRRGRDYWRTPRFLGLGNWRDRQRNRRHGRARSRSRDRKSTRLNSSHGYISYAVFCLKKKKKKPTHIDDYTH